MSSESSTSLKTPEKAKGKRSVEGFVLKLSPIKRSKTTGKEYFDLSFQTDKKPVRAVCFSPDKWKKLNEYSESGSSCEIRNLNMSNTTDDYFITQHSSVKSKKVLFDKNEVIETTSIDKIINEMPLFARVHITAKIIRLADLKTEMYDGKNINVRQCTISDGKGCMTLTVFDKLCKDLEENEVYLFSYLSVSQYEQKKILKSSDMSLITASDTEIEVSQEILDDVPTSNEEILSFVCVDSASLKSICMCVNCKSKLVVGSGKVIKCGVCHTTSMVSLCTSTVTVRLKPIDRNLWLNVNEKVLLSILPTDITLSDEDDFVEFVLTNKFKVTILEKSIVSMSLVA